MFDGFWCGIFGGLLGPTIAQWLSRFKYWVIFLVAMIVTYIGLFVAGIYTKGLRIAMEVMLIKPSTPVVFLVPMCIGLLAVFVAFVGSLNAPSKDVKSDRDDKK